MPAPTLYEKFEQFDAQNPHVYNTFVKYADELLQSGKRTGSAWLIVNRMRWDDEISTTGDRFKISNDFIAFYARKLVAEQPAKYASFFKLKTMSRA